MRGAGNAVGAKAPRGFESHPFRNVQNFKEIFTLLGRKIAEQFVRPASWKKPSVQTMAKIAKTLGVSIEDLIK